MPRWDEDSAQLRANLMEVWRDAAARRSVTLDTVKEWHRRTMRGLDIPEAADLNVTPADLIGEFRGPPTLRHVVVEIGGRRGVAPDQVAVQCEVFIDTLRQLLDQLDGMLPVDQLDRLDADGRRAVAEAAAWAHSEWVRIHPFANGNGRTARLLGNAILVRYGLPPVFRLRPRPAGSYAFAATASMDSDHLPMADYVVDQIDRWQP
jgi:Fic/DOC family